MQNILAGMSEQCPGTPNLLGPADGGAAYVIDEDVAANPTAGTGSAAPMGTVFVELDFGAIFYSNFLKL